MQKCNKYKKVYQKCQQFFKSFVKMYRKRLLDNLIDKNEYEFLCITFPKYLEETKNESFL